MTEVIGSFNEQIQFFVTISKFWFITKVCLDIRALAKIFNGIFQ